MKKNKLKFCPIFAFFIMLASACPMQVFAAKETKIQDTTIQIVHTNDIHGYYTETENGALGFAILKTIVDQEGADLVLDMGDTFHGQAFATINQGSSIAQLMKYIGYDAVTPGNHDWSYGADRLKELEKIGGFEILAANVITENGTDFFDENYIIKEVTADDGTKLKVGVIGVIDDAFYSSTAFDNIAGLKFKEEAQEATKIAAYLSDVEKCDLILAMTHQSDCASFVANIKGIDAVLAGHEHIAMNESYPDSEGKMVPVAEAGYYMNHVGVMEVTLDAESKEVLSVEDRFYTMENLDGIVASEQIKEKISEIENQQQAILAQTIGYTKQAYPYKWEDVRISQQEIGKFVTESYLETTGADIAFENAGGIRAGLETGAITYRDIISISPYGNIVITKNLTGKEIVDILNESLAIGKACDDVYTIQKEAVQKGEDPYQYSWPEHSGSYLQFSGIQIETDGSAKIVSAKINGMDIKENEIYVVAMNEYLGESDVYPALAEADLEQEFGTCEQALLKYVEDRQDMQTKEASDETALPKALTREEAADLLVEAAKPYYPHIEKSDIMKGYEDGLLYEDKEVTKIEALVMMRRAFDALPVASGNSSVSVEDFRDMPTWAKSEMDDVLQSGIVEAPFTADEMMYAEEMEAYIMGVVELIDTNEN